MTRNRTRNRLGPAAGAATLALGLALLPPASLHAAARPGLGQEGPPSPRTAAAAREDDYARAHRLLDQGDPKGAAELFKRAAAKHGAEADVWFFLGLALSRANKQKDARKAFEKAVSLRDSAPARMGLAFTLFLLGKTEDAEREARKALALNPRLAQAHYVLAVVHFRGDDFEQAARAAEEALRLDPKLVAAAVLAGEALLNLYGQESERAFTRHPIPVGADEAARAAALDRREEMLAPSKGRLRAAAERLQGLADSAAVAAVKRDAGELAATLKAYGAPRKQGDPPDVFRQAEVSTKAVIINKPVPGYTEEARHNGTGGVVRLRAVLAADGRVRHIMVMRRLPDGLTEMAVEAARKIRFTPATLGGRRVSQYVVLEYRFGSG